MKNKLLGLALTLSISCSVTAQVVEPYTRAAGWEKEIAAMEAIDRRQSPPENAVLFTGSSSIRMWESLRSDFPSIRFINRGFGGSHLEDLVYFAPRIVVPYKPRLIVVYSGENDIEVGQTAENVLGDFHAFVRLRDEKLPKTPIVYISMKPSIARWAKWPEMAKGNRLIAEASRKMKNVTFVDVSKGMLGSDGTPMSDIFLDDRLHMNAKGYAIWTEILRPYVR